MVIIRSNIPPVDQVEVGRETLREFIPGHETRVGKGNLKIEEEGAGVIKIVLDSLMTLFNSCARGLFLRIRDGSVEKLLCYPDAEKE